MRLMSEENRFEKLRHEMEKNAANKEHFVPYLGWFLNSVLTESTYAEIRRDRARSATDKSRNSNIEVAHSHESLQTCTQEKLATFTKSTSQSTASGILFRKGSVKRSLQDADLSTGSRIVSYLQHSPSTSPPSQYDSMLLPQRTVAKELTHGSSATMQARSSDECVVGTLEGVPDNSSKEEEMTDLVIETNDICDLHSGSTTIVQTAESSEENPLEMDDDRALQQKIGLDHADYDIAESFKHTKMRDIQYGRPRGFSVAPPSLAYQQTVMRLSLPPPESEGHAKEQEDGKTNSFTYHFPECGIVFSIVPTGPTKYSSILQGSQRIQVTQSNSDKVQLQEGKAEADSDEHSQSSSSSSSSTEMNINDEVSKSSLTEEDDITCKSRDSFSSFSNDDGDDFLRMLQSPPKKEKSFLALYQTRRASTPTPRSHFIRWQNSSLSCQQRLDQMAQVPASTESSLDRYRVWTSHYLKKHSRQNKIRTLLFSSTWLSESRCLDISLQIEPSTRS